jgi:hypothetical protein
MFKDLQRLIQQSQQEQYSIINSKFEKLQGKPFWIWDIKEHKQEDANTNGDCCFNHIIGLPQKDGNNKPL